MASEADVVGGSAGFLEEQRQRHPNAYRAWTVAEDERLAVRVVEGASVADLIEEFGRNRGAIRSRLARIGAGVAGAG